MRAELEAAIARVLDSGEFIGGREVIAFERELAAALRVQYAIGSSSGTDALQMLGMALGIKRGDEVVTTPFTFVATASAFARLGARVVFADIDEATMTLDPNAAASVLTDRTRAVVVVNLFGRSAEIPDAPCPVLEDAAQSIDSCALRGLAAALSFFPTKNLGALGDAGAILTNDGALADQLALLRGQGARPKYHHVVLGGNFRLDALQAAVLRSKLRYLTASTAARRAHAQRYRELFDSAGIPPEVRLPPHHENDVFHQFVIRAPERDELRSFLAEHGVGTEVYYPCPLHLQPCFAELGYGEGAFPVAELACRTALALPIHPAVTHDSQTYVVEQIAAFYRR